MRLPAFADVCLRVLMQLASNGDSQSTTREVAESIGVPYHHVSKAVLELRRRGAVDAVRGRGGGVRITGAGLELSVGAFLRSIDDDPDIVECTRDDGPTCPLIADCRLRVAFRRAREAFYASLDPVVVRDLVGDAAGPVALPMPSMPAR